MFLRSKLYMDRLNGLTRHRLLLIGWTVFIFSIFLPVNVSNGGLTDAGKPYLGLLHIFYSFLSWGVIMEGLHWEDETKAYWIIANAVVGLFNLLMIFAPALLLLRGVLLWAARVIMVVGALYVCTVGFLITHHYFQILFGFYVWCLSFVSVAVSLFLRRERGNEAG
jgi:hypothetical protein